MTDEHGATEFGLVGEVPYYATIFTTRMTSDLDGYEETADRMAELVSAREGFLGMQSADSSAARTTATADLIGRP